MNAYYVTCALITVLCTYFCNIKPLLEDSCSCKQAGITGKMWFITCEYWLCFVWEFRFKLPNS